MNAKAKLLTQYSNILNELKSGDISESKLDAYLLFFSNQLQNKTNIDETSKEKLQEMTESLDMAQFEEAVKQAYQAYQGNTEPDKKTINILKGKDLKKIEGIPEKFVKYIDSLFRMIEPEALKKANSKETNERLYSYFEKGNYKYQDIKVHKPKAKTDKQILEEIEQNSESWEIPETTINYMWQGIKNHNLIDQSNLNRARSLHKSGATLEESIKVVVPNRATRKDIYQIVKLNQKKAQMLNEAQKRLY